MVASYISGSLSTEAPPSWHTYTYTPTEKNIFFPSPYKDRLLPMWRFRTPAIARASADDLWSAFLDYEKQDDFVGMDNARKFLQMGMTRAKRYANHRGGRKYVPENGNGDSVKAIEEVKQDVDGVSMGVERKRKRRKVEVKEGEDWEGRKEKEEASLIFREVWEKAKNWEGYVRRREELLRGQKEWKKCQKAGKPVMKVKKTKGKRVKDEDESD